MRIALRTVAVLAVVSSCLASATTAGFAQRVTRVIDGDTIAVEGVGTVRLIGVDTPETVHPSQPVQAFGAEATAFTRRLAEGQVVRLDYDWERRDRYNRTLAYVYLEDGTFLNAEIVRQGFGHAYTQYPFKHLDEFRALEREAREAGRGLGGADQAPVPQQAQAAQASSADQKGVTVYVTRTGKKYHAAGCRHLARSQIPMSLAEAAATYGPCSVCGPPVAGSAAVTKAGGVAPSQAGATSRPAATSGRCQATTRKGTQCSRRAQPGRSYCWQH